MNSIRQSLIKSRSIYRNQRARNFALLTTVEEYPIQFKVQHSPISPVKFNNTVLSSGVKVQTNGHANPIVNVTFSVSSGSAYESSSLKGAAHYLSKTVFAGTAHRSGLKLLRDLENIGAKVSSSVDRETLSIELSVLSDKLEPAFALIAESIVSPVKLPYVVSELRDQVAVDYDALSASPKLQLEELIHEAAFSETSAFGSSIYADSVDEITAANVFDLRSKTFKSGNLTIKADGAQHDVICALTECYFQSLSTGNEPLPQSTYLGGDLKVKAKLSGVNYTGLAFPVSTNDGLVTSIIVDSLLNTFKSNKSVIPFTKTYSQVGLFGFTVSGDSTAVNQYLADAINELKSIASSKTTVTPSIKKVTLENAISNDTLSTSAVKPVAEITPEKVATVASSILKSKPTLVVLGKTAGSPNFSQISDLLK